MVNLNLSAIFKIQFTTPLKHIILHCFVFSANRIDFTMKIGFLKFVSLKIFITTSLFYMAGVFIVAQFLFLKEISGKPSTILNCMPIQSHCMCCPKHSTTTSHLHHAVSKNNLLPEQPQQIYLSYLKPGWAVLLC